MTSYFDLYDLGWHRRIRAIRALSSDELREALSIAAQMVAASENLGTVSLETELQRERERRYGGSIAPFG